MMNSYKKLLYSIVSLTFLFAIPVDLIAIQFPSDDSGYFTEGIAALESGNVDEALQIWQGAMDSREPDYRVGYYFLKTVTEHSKREHYQKASELYYRGLNTSSVSDEDAELLLLDLEFMRPLLGMREGSSFERLINDRDPEIYSEFKNFWNSVKLTISGTYNERLLEHWERVHHVSRNFDTYRRGSFDDRGDIYLKYGEPGRKRSGTLMYNSGLAEYLISARMNDGGSGGADGAVNATSFMNTMNLVRTYHEYPNYEVWVYYDLADDRDNIVYLFGNTTGSNMMRRVQSVDDFVPSAAYSSSRRNSVTSLSTIALSGGGDEVASSGGENSNTDVELDGGTGFVGSQEPISPAVILQIMYYRQMVNIDDYFSRRYSRMIDQYMSTASRLGSQIARQFQHVNTARMLQVQGMAPDHRSTQLESIFTINSDLYAYRFLDENMEPYLRVYLDTDTEEAITYDELRRNNNLESISHQDFEIINQLQLIDGGQESVGVILDTLKIIGDEQPIEDPLVFNVVSVKHEEQLSEIMSNFELHNRNDYAAGRISESSTFFEHLKGIGESRTEIKPALKSENFISSDIILGYSSIDEGGESMLTIAHNSIIPQNRNLNFYYEAYNLPQNEDGYYSFSLTYEIERDRSWFGRVIRFGRTSEPSITIENTEDRPVFSQMLEIVSEKLQEGDYKLNLTFMDGENEILDEREIKFTIKDID